MPKCNTEIKFKIHIVLQEVVWATYYNTYKNETKGVLLSPTIVEKLDGWIKVESHFGKGTKFTVVLDQKIDKDTNSYCKLLFDAYVVRYGNMGSFKEDRY